jgi:large subunit ribosomal protein L19
MEWQQRAQQGTRERVKAEFRPGDQVRVWCRIQERDRVRLAPFEGTVIRLRGAGASQTMTIRRVTFGEGVERVFSLDAPLIDRIEVIRRGDVRRSRLYFLRTVIGKTRIAAKEGDVADEKSAEAELATEKDADATAAAGQSSGGQPPTT